MRAFLFNEIYVLQLANYWCLYVTLAKLNFSSI